MATDLETRQSSSKSEAHLRRKFADLGARIQRVDIVAHLLGIVLTLLGYALAVGVFDWLVGNSTTANVIAVRWTAFIGVLILVAFLFVQTARCFFRRVNPYYVAHRLEETVPDAKNGLINWLDLYDAEIPSAFRKNLSSRAADQWQEGDADQIVPIDDASRLAAKLVKHSTLKIYPGGSHGMCTVNADEVNADLLAFLKT